MISFVTRMNIFLKFSILKHDKYLRFIPQGTVDTNLGPDRLAGPEALDPKLLQTTNPLIARPLSGSPNYAWY